jgi:hypothetical protein
MKQGRGSKLVEYLKSMEADLDRDLNIVETGSIRNDSERNHLGDGWSTYYIAKFISESKFHHNFTSIDLKTAVANKFLKDKGLDRHVHLIKGNSLDVLRDIEGQLDLVYLDSANNADQIFNELMLVKDKLSKNNIVIIDDIKTDKPKKVLPYLKANDLEFKIEGRHLIFSL